MLHVFSSIQGIFSPRVDRVIPTTATEKAEVFYHQVSTSTIRASETNDEPLSVELTHGRRQNTTKCHSLPPFTSSEGTKIQATVSKALQDEVCVILPQTDRGSRGDPPCPSRPADRAPSPGALRSARGTPGLRGAPRAPARPGAPRTAGTSRLL